jgi:hypothetical protein
MTDATTPSNPESTDDEATTSSTTQPTSGGNAFRQPVVLLSIIVAFLAGAVLGGVVLGGSDQATETVADGELEFTIEPGDNAGDESAIEVDCDPQDPLIVDPSTDTAFGEDSMYDRAPLDRVSLCQPIVYPVDVFDCVYESVELIPGDSGYNNVFVTGRMSVSRDARYPDYVCGIRELFDTDGLAWDCVDNNSADRGRTETFSGDTYCELPNDVKLDGAVVGVNPNGGKGESAKVYLKLP